VEKDAYRKRFDTSDAIILPMVQKGKVEETIIESIPQLVIQITNTWQLGQLLIMPALTIFSISLSVISLTNTVWYYAYWNVFRCMPIRDVPSTLSLYNYKLSGVTDGAFSFAKASSEVVEIELSELEKMRSVTVSGTVLNDDAADDEQLDQLPPKNVMEHPDASDLMPGAVESNAEISRLRTENQEMAAENAKLRKMKDENEACISNLREEKELENKQMEAENAKLRESQKENEASILMLIQEKQQMETENSRMRLELQRLANITLDSADDHAQVAVHSERAGDATGGVTDGNQSPSSPRSRAAVIIQSATRGHIGRRMFRAAAW